MDFLGIGPAELVMIVILLLLFLGPTDVVELLRKVGRAVRKLRESPTWTMINSTARSLRNLPNTLAEETGIEDLRKDLRRGAEFSRSIGKSPAEREKKPGTGTHEMPDLSAWTTPPVADSLTPPPSNIRTRPPAGDEPAAAGTNNGPTAAPEGPEQGSPAPSVQKEEPTSQSAKDSSETA